MELMRLSGPDLDLARATFAMMGEVFDDEPWTPLRDSYLRPLLQDGRRWVYAAVVDGRPVGGLVAHQLPMTRAETDEVLVYDLAVHPDHQRQGVGRSLVDRVLHDAAAQGIDEVWVPADDDDQHALEFYRRTGGTPQAVTVFTYRTGGRRPRADGVPGPPRR